MQRVLIIGSGGAGKSTLARRIAAITKLPLIHLDQHYFDPGWVEPSKEEWEGRVAKLIQNDQWVMDGNYGGTMDMRIERADTIIFLDLSAWLCLWRILKRRWQYKGKVRPGSAEGCYEMIEMQFLHYVAAYPYTRRPAILKKLALLPEEKKRYILRSRGEVSDFLEKLDLS